MHFAKWTRALDWLPGDRSTDHFPTTASQNFQREVIAGKAVASFSGAATWSCLSNASSGQAFMAHLTLRIGLEALLKTV
jgi:hypothetical protein